MDVNMDNLDLDAKENDKSENQLDAKENDKINQLAESSDDDEISIGTDRQFSAVVPGDKNV